MLLKPPLLLHSQNGIGAPADGSGAWWTPTLGYRRIGGMSCTDTWASCLDWDSWSWPALFDHAIHDPFMEGISKARFHGWLRFPRLVRLEWFGQVKCGRYECPAPFVLKMDKTCCGTCYAPDNKVHHTWYSLHSEWSPRCKKLYDKASATPGLFGRLASTFLVPVCASWRGCPSRAEPNPKFHKRDLGFGICLLVPNIACGQNILTYVWILMWTSLAHPVSSYWPGGDLCVHRQNVFGV
jgi:hypothetical protein